MSDESNLIIIFDTDCVMCAAWVQFILKYERQPLAQFVSAWSEQGLSLAANYDLSPENLDETYLVIFNGKPYTKSDATFTIFKTLKAPWHWISLFKIFPRFIRDWFYDRMAKNRYHWFGRADQCFIPPKDQEFRFVSGPPRSANLPNHR